MYVTGNINDYVSRLHQLPTGQSDLTNFETEGYSYTGLTTTFPLYQSQRFLQYHTQALTSSGYIPHTGFYNGYRYHGSNAILRYLYNLTGSDNLIVHGDSFSNWLIDSAGSFKTSSGIYLTQNGTSEYARYRISGLTPSTQYWLSVTIAELISGANLGNLRLQDHTTDGSNFDPVFPNNTVNFDFPSGRTGKFYCLLATDTTNTGSHMLAFRQATSAAGSYIRISDVALYDNPSRSSAKVAVLGDRTSSYGAANANDVARAILSTTGDTKNIIGVGDYADGGTQYAVNNDIKTGIGGLTGISGLGGNMYMVPGNWDYSNDGDLSNFRDYFGFNGFTYPNGYNGSGSYKVTLGYVDYFLIDSVRIKDAASVAAAQALPEGQFLITGLAAATSPFKIVVWHYPSHTSSSHHAQTVYPAQRWDWSGLGVQAVLSSHDHVYERSLVSGCYYYTLGIGGGAINAFGAAQQYSVYTGLQYGYLKVYDSPTDLVLEYRGVQDPGTLTVPCHYLNDRVRIVRYTA